jgi:hypothetical protein
MAILVDEAQLQYRMEEAQWVGGVVSGMETPHITRMKIRRKKT